MLETDVCEIVSAVQAEATARFLHVLPPGYEDARKIQNPYGDLIIWKEILEKCSEVQAESAVLLTNDLKRDWVVKPDFLILEGGYQVPNNGKQEREYFIPSPQLIHEFRLCTGRSDFHIVDIELLTSLLFSFEHNRLTYQEFEQLASAVQIDKEISPTQQVIQWFVNNQDAYNNALHGVCRWHYDPSEVDFDKLYEWAVERISDVDLNLVNWGDVFCELFL